MDQAFGAEYLSSVEAPGFGGATWTQQCSMDEYLFVTCVWTRVGSREIV